MAELNIAIVATNQAQGTLNSLKGGLGDIQKAAQSAQEKLRGMGDSLKGLGTGMTVGVTAPILGFVGAALKSAVANEQLTISFTTMLGSAEKAKNMMAEIATFAAATPFESTEIQGAAKTLLGLGISAEKIIPTLTTLGDISSGLNIPLGELSEIYGKVKTAGVAMSGDLMEFAGRGIPIYAALAKQLGVAETEIKGLASQGKIGFKDIEAAFASLNAEGGMFFNLMAAQSQSVGGLLSTVTDNLEQLLTAVGLGIFEAFDVHALLTGFNVQLEKARVFVVNFAKTQPQLFKFIAIFAGIAAAIGPVMIGLGFLLTTLAPLVPVIGAVGAAFALLLSPLGLVAAGIAALFVFDVGGIRTKFVAMAQGIGKSLLLVASKAKNIFKVFEDGSSYIGGLFEALGVSEEKVMEVGLAVYDLKGAIDRGDLFKVFEDGSSYIGGVIESLGVSEEKVMAVGLAIYDLKAAFGRGDLFKVFEDGSSYIGGLVTALGVSERRVMAVGQAIYDLKGAFARGGFAEVFKVFEDGSSYIGGLVEALGASEETVMSVGQAFYDVKAALTDFVKTGDTEGLKAIGERIKEAFANIDPPSISEVWNAAKLTITTVFSNIEWDVPKGQFDKIKGAVIAAIAAIPWSDLGGVGKGAVGLFGSLKTAVIAQLAAIDWSGMAAGVGKGATGIFSSLKTFVQGQLAAIDWSTLVGMGKGATGLFDKLKTIVRLQLSGINWSDISNNANVLFGKLIIAVKSAISAINWSALVTNAGVYFAGVKHAVQNALSAINWSDIASGVGKGATNIFSPLKTAVQAQLATVQWSTLPADTLTKLQTGATGLKEAVLGAITNFEWTVSPEQTAQLQEMLTGIQPVIDQIFGPTGIVTTITSTINESIVAIGERLEGVDGEKLGQQFSGILTGFAGLATAFAGMQVEGAATKAASIISLGTDVLTFLSEFGKGLDVETIATAISGFAATFVAQLGTVFTDENTASLGTAVGTFASTIITKIGEFFGTAGFGEDMGEAAGSAVSTLAKAAANIVTGIANELAKVDWETVGGQLDSFMSGFVGGLSAKMAETDWAPIGNALVTGIKKAVEALLAGAFTIEPGGTFDVLRNLLSGLKGKGPEPFGNPFDRKMGPMEDPSKKFDLGTVIPPIDWSVFVTPLGWLDFVTSLNWGQWIVGLSWATYVTHLTWANWVSRLNWRSWVDKLNWGDFIPGWLKDLSQPNSQAGRTPPKAGGPAVGTNNFRGGLAWVGEAGPELAWLPAHTRVYSHGESMALAGAQPVVINNYNTINTPLDVQSLAYQVASIIDRRRR